MNKFILGIISTVIAGLILSILDSDEPKQYNQVSNNKQFISNSSNIQISNNQQAVSTSSNGGSSNVTQNNNQSININYSNK